MLGISLQSYVLRCLPRQLGRCLSCEPSCPSFRITRHIVYLVAIQCFGLVNFLISQFFLSIAGPTIQIIHLLNWLILVFFATSVQSLPSREHYLFTIALCNCSDIREADIVIKSVKRFFTSTGANIPGLHRFIQEQPHRAVDFEATDVNGWFTTDASYAKIVNYNHQQRLDQCRDTVTRAGFVVSSV